MTFRTGVVGISGPSSSGKTTLARLLQRIFSKAEESLRTFIIHEDDFYFPDDQIPYTTTASGKTVQDWDTIDAIDIKFLSSTLSYVRERGRLPPRLKSVQDLNEKTDSGVDEETILQLQKEVASRVRSLLQQQQHADPGSEGTVSQVKRTVAFLEGFLLYSPPTSENKDHTLRPVHENIDVHLFLPAPYDTVKSRRENRPGYVTNGPAPEPTSLPQKSSESNDGAYGEIDLEGEDDRPPQNFWTDPPGYVDDIVWPRYVQDHAWLLLPKGDSQQGNILSMDCQELLKKVGQGVNLRTDAGVSVAPGQGTKPMVETLKWAVEEVMKYLEAAQQRQ
ncbi:ribosylnicotinamide kinase [Aspergillus hancockii]|nr:ribosylnicotinamide kinase [Aspergillus hancockii]